MLESNHSKESIANFGFRLEWTITQEMCPFPSFLHRSLKYSANKYVALRPGCIDFLKALFERGNVGIWSIEEEEDIYSVIDSLQKESR